MLKKKSLVQEVAERHLAAASPIGPYSSLEEAQGDVRSVFDGLEATRKRLTHTVRMLQSSDEQMLANKTQKMLQSVEDLMGRMQESFPHLVSF